MLPDVFERAHHVRHGGDGVDDMLSTALLDNVAAAQMIRHQGGLSPQLVDVQDGRAHGNVVGAWSRLKEPKQ
jgi:hypothetical protein